MLVDGVEVPDEKAPEEVFEEFFNTALELPLPGEDEKVKTAEEITADTKLAEEAKLAAENKPAEGEETLEEKTARKAAKKAAREAETPEDRDIRIAAKEAEKAAEKVIRDEEKEQRRIAKKVREATAVAAVVNPKPVVPEKVVSAEEQKQIDEENATLAEYEKNWEDHAKAQKINNKRLLAEVEKIFNQVVAPLVQKIPGIEQAVATTAQDKALNTVLKDHPDAVELVPKVDAWIATLPKYLQKAATDTLDGGSPEDVVELYNDFKEATGIKKVEVVIPPVVKEIVKPEENKRVLSLVSPKSSRTGVAASVDTNDFDGAFKEALTVI